MISPYRNRLPMAYLPASRAVDTVGMHPMFYGRVSGVGTPVARLDDGTETVFYPAGKRYRFQEQSTRIVMDGGVPRFEVNPTLARTEVMYDLQVTVKDYVPGSGQVKYTTWGRALYPGFNPTPNWQTVPESDFIAMYPEWVSIRDAKFGSPVPTGSSVPPVATPTPKPAGSALPLLLGAAFLLLS